MARTYRKDDGGLYYNVAHMMRRAEHLAALRAKRKGERKQTARRLMDEAEAELQTQAQLAREVC
jgi:hypothetical protein